MSNDKVVSLHVPAEDVLGELLKSGAKQLLVQAVEAELNELLDRHKDLSLDDGRQALVKMVFCQKEPFKPVWAIYPLKSPKSGIVAGKVLNLTVILCRPI